MLTKKPVLLFTCEHAVNHIPERYKDLFQPFKTLLATHRGIDFGAQELAQYLSQAFSAPLIMAEVSRLLIDCNRSANHKQCFSEVSEPLSTEEKAEIIQNYYLPYRKKVIQAVETFIKKGHQVIHLSIHSFTPIMHDIVRNAEIGFLYDPKRKSEKVFIELWRQQFKAISKDERVRLNYPYRGTSDGFTTYLRKQFIAEEYVGIEVECNQRVAIDALASQKIAKALEESLRLALKNYPFDNFYLL